MYAYVAPIYNEGLNVGGVLTEGDIIFYDTCQRGNGAGAGCNTLLNSDCSNIPEMTESPCIGANEINGCECGCSN